MLGVCHRALFAVLGPRHRDSFVVMGLRHRDPFAVLGLRHRDLMLVLRHIGPLLQRVVAPPRLSTGRRKDSRTRTDPSLRLVAPLLPAPALYLHRRTDELPNKRVVALGLYHMDSWPLRRSALLVVALFQTF